MKILYISYDGILEPLGQSQVIRYLEMLSIDCKIFIISFEKEIDLANKILINNELIKLRKLGIDWQYFRYHKSPAIFSTLYDMFICLVSSFIIIKRNNIKIIHCRSYVPTLIALINKYIFGLKVIFDIRGFWADEKVDGGIWSKESTIYILVKYLEKYFFQKSDYIVTLTKASIPFIKDKNLLEIKSNKISVIPTCVDLQHFNFDENIKIEKGYIFGYVGSFGTYYLIEETLLLFKSILVQRNDAKMLILNRFEHKKIYETCIKLMIPIDKIEIKKVSHHEVVKYVKRMDSACALIKQCYSKIASSPTKVGEYLACGVPFVMNRGTGDLESIVNEYKIGVVINSFTPESINEAAKDILKLSSTKNIKNKCRNVAEKIFSLKSGVNEYRKIYDLLNEKIIM